MRTLGFVLLAAALVAFILIWVTVRGARRRRAQRSYVAQQTGDDDSPTGYVQGVWLLGGGDAPKSRDHHRHDHHSGDHRSGHDASSSSHHGGSAGHDGGGSD